MILGDCAVHECRELAEVDAPLCARHLLQLDDRQRGELLIAWRAYAMSDLIVDARIYSCRLRAALLALDLTPPLPGPVQLRLVK